MKHAVGTRELFVSDYGSGDVYIFGIPLMTLEATLTGFTSPQGLCSDLSGDVWVTDTFASRIFEYAHDGTLLNTLTDPSGFPVGCAWDRKTGNLAVTNVYSFGTGQPQGAILIYRGASGTPTAHTDRDMYYYYFPAYDTRGNLYIDGTGPKPAASFVLAELRKGDDSASTISLSGGTIYFPGALQWYPALNYLIVGDQNCGGNILAETSCLYSVDISNFHGGVGSSTQVDNISGTPACDVMQAVRIGKRVYGSDYEFAPSPYAACASGGTAPPMTYRWLYPAGGMQTGITTTLTEVIPSGSAISN